MAETYDSTPTEEGVGDLLFLSRDAVDRLRPHKEEFVGILNDALGHLHLENVQVTDEVLWTRRVIVTVLFEDMRKRFDLETFIVSAEQIMMPKESFNEMEGRVGPLGVYAIVGGDPWVLTGGKNSSCRGVTRQGKQTIESIPGVFRYFLRKFSRSDEVDVLRFLVAVNSLLELVSQLHGETDLYGKLRQIQLGEMTVLRNVCLKLEVENHRP